MGRYDDYEYEPGNNDNYTHDLFRDYGIDWTPELDAWLGHAEYAGRDLDDPSVAEELVDLYLEAMNAGWDVHSDEWEAWMDAIGYEDVDWDSEKYDEAT